MLKAFSYMFSDNTFKKKAAVYFLFYFVAMSLLLICQLYSSTKSIIILLLAGIVVSFVPLGYQMVECIKSIREQDDNVILPFMDIKKSFISGFKYVVSLSLTGILLGFMILLVTLLLALLGAALKNLILVKVLILLFFVGIFSLIIIYIPAFSCIFAEKQWITSYLRFIKATKLITQSKGHYLKYTGLYTLMSILMSIFTTIIQAIFCKGIWGAVLAAALLSIFYSYIAFVIAYIAAKSIKVKITE